MATTFLAPYVMLTVHLEKVVLYNNGESNGSGSSTSGLMLPGRFAQEIQGAAIELERE